MPLLTPLRGVATRSRHLLRRKLRQTNRLSRKSLPMALLLGGAALVALVSLGFAYLADLALEWNREWVGRVGWLALLVLPCALAALRWATLRFAPNAAGSGIPQVIGALSLPPGPSQRSLVSLAQVLWKIPLAFFGMLAGASIGREGPSVQVGAAVMLAWGDFWKRRGLQLRGFHANELLAAGAAGGLAAAFNAPLAGVIFAIEELGRGTVLRWQRLVLIGVLAAGFLVVAVQGNNPYFGTFAGAPLTHGMLWWVLICAALNGALGGIFARLLGKGPAAMAPASWRAWIRAHPIWTAFAMGVALALIGLATAGSVYGTGYGAAADLLSGETRHALPAGFGLAKLAATVASYWAGIPGGIFTPALTTGAGIGHHIWELAGEGVDQRVLVLVSMAAFLAAATQAPLTASVVVMEMTGSQPMLFWLLVGSLLAAGVSRQFCPQPFYHLAAGRFRRQAIVEAGRAARSGAPAGSPAVR
ncbi:chloride channel protein [Achromobacter ruhlandii]|uniref:chloride channel protein n=1 Tax=Achromobacter ruhlandii TaxID=72557 RepID=UPI0006C2D9EA|nr:chloride channel protein [Achromobacter ruhlandii]AMG46141.1 chloride channel protein EriC [Achromobacter xylosoxidans]CUI70149.1 H(+)/Cl(-) exchange transporter ClcA [Achromobacter ruhlandii]CUJ82629.1 H(+)/Cl(-) exchange transporter ClcA [Achromobacter ruhlandii]